MDRDLEAAQAEAQRICRAIYVDFRRAFEERFVPVLRDKKQEHGFRILYGPPLIDAPVLFIGFQPGGRSESRLAGEHEGWPPVCDYGNSCIKWPLARRIREIWGAETAKQSIGTNALFVRCPSKKTWSGLNSAFRRDVAEESRRHLETIIATLRPRRIVIIGLTTDDEAQGWPVVLRGRRDRVLVRRCESPADGIRTEAVIHLSGARLAGTDVDLLKDYFACGRD